LGGDQFASPPMEVRFIQTLLADLGQCLLYQRQCPTVVSPPRFAPGLQTEKNGLFARSPPARLTATSSAHRMLPKTPADDEEN
jgi:hypothetical protein